MQIRDTGAGYGPRYEARGRFTGYGASPYAAERDAREREREWDESCARTNRFLLDTAFRHGGPVLAKALRSCCNLAIRPLPTLLVGGFFWCLNLLAALFVPPGTWWAWGMHGAILLAALGAMATAPGEIEALEGDIIGAITRGFPIAYRILYWSAMAASVFASGYMAGLAFDWLEGHGFLHPEGIPHFREGTQLAAGLATFVWRGDHHPTLDRPPVPLLGW